MRFKILFYFFLFTKLQKNKEQDNYPEESLYRYVNLMTCNSGYHYRHIRLAGRKLYSALLPAQLIYCLETRVHRYSETLRQR